MEHQISKKHIQEGDMILFSDAKDKKGNIINRNHVAIVYKVINDSTIIIAEQNVGDNKHIVYVTCGGVKNTPVVLGSKLVLSTFNFNDFWGREYMYNHISFYRF
ncbi:MAG: CHAP domain-containing protein [Bacteroidetes bacterium]|nr:CHAP domain-containing protein [Bacteroidota bacterium]